MKVPRKLTRSSLLYLFCSDSENIQNFHHYLHDNVRHCRGWWNLRICLQALEEVLDPFKDVDQDLSRCTDVLNRLMRVDVKLELQLKEMKIKYRPGEGHQLQQRSLLRVRKPT